MDKQIENGQMFITDPCRGLGCAVIQENEISLFELWKIIWRGKFFIAGFMLFSAFATILVTFFVLPVTYKSEAVLIQNGSEAGGMAGMAGLAASLPIPLGLSSGKANNLLDFLQSRNLKRKLIEKYDLLPWYYKDKWDSVKHTWLVRDHKDVPTVVGALQRNLLSGVYQATQDKNTQLVTITWVDEDPSFAAEMLKRVISELEYYLANEYVSDAKRERQFIESQLSDATRDLEYWEQQVPSQQLTVAKIQREVLAASSVYAELRKQVELAKIAEAKELVNFKVLDQPFVPEIKFKPKRVLICTLTIITSGLLSIVIVLVWQSFMAHIPPKKGV